MSQEGLVDVIGNTPVIPTEFIANVGSAVPILNTLEILAASVAAGTNPARTIGSGNTITTEVQISQAIASTNATNVGLAAFDSAFFSVDANGFVSFIPAAASTQLAVDASTPPGTNPVSPTAGIITITGGQVAAGVVGTNVIRTNSLAANTLTIQVQRSTAVGSSTVASNGVAHFNSGQFSVDSNGFVSLLGGGEAIDSVAVQTGTSPVVPDSNGLITINGGVVAAGTNPLRSNGTGANTLALQVQISQAVASTDATTIGLSAFDSSSFAVDANGFVTLSTTGAGKTITGDSGGALSPTANNWNILGRSGCKTSGSGSTLTIQGPPYSDVGTTGTSVLNSGEFVTAAVTRTLPASAGLQSGDLIEFVVTSASTLVIQAVGSQTIRIGSGVSTTAGTATSTAIGCTLSLRFRSTDQVWYDTSSTGSWILA